MEDDHTFDSHNHLSTKDRKKMGIVDDYICAMCDEGGELIYCDGECGRLFHPNRGKGTYNCTTLCLSEEQVNLPKFLCKNCEHKQHQCFICGQLGSSDLSSVLAKVFQCNNQYCGRFYHLQCLSQYDHRSFSHLKCFVHDPNKKPLVFECPMHECCSCKNKGEKMVGKETTDAKKLESESKGEKKMYLALCRRCPVAYHWKCLPRDISSVAYGEFTRAWQIAGRLFFYCKKHEVVKGLESARRGHLIFPKVEEERKVNNGAEIQERPAKIVHSFDLNVPLREEPEASEP
ncbi:unnamed protein product [Urochloa decumbens]|uniref:Zinc finger PHD-type domain-containing protein n=1 Tax=Urochloa decumbens TaxID=240449 RepID=A0ABC8WRV2_9POAL